MSLLAIIGPGLSATPAVAQTTALYFDSQPGDYIGDDGVTTYLPADATFTIQRNFNNGVSLSVLHPAYSFWWYLDFAAASGAPLSVGTYQPATRYPFATGHGLSVSGSGRGCNQLTGWFIVREIEVVGDTVARFAADFEQHCEDGNAGLFGAIRYNSTISDLVPFGGDYPSYELTILPSAHGRVTGGGIDCGGAATTCSATFVSPTEVVLSAVPDAGYAFAGWSGSCSGAIAIWLRVNQQKTCAAIFEPGFQGVTALYLDSENGDLIGQGIEQTLTPTDGTFTVQSNFNNGVSLSIRHPNTSLRWTLDFASATKLPLAVGTYEPATRYPFAIGHGLSITGSGGGCNDLTGRFVVREVELSGTTLVRFAADFEQHCGDANAGLFGAIRYNSTISDLVPFGGDYPNYELTILPSAHGRVTGGGIDCGGAATNCSVTFVSPTEVVLSAVPDAGYAFAGWSGSCSGTIAIWLRVNQRKTCTAIFVPGFHGTTALYADSEPGDPLAQGSDSTVTPVDGIFNISRNSRNGVSVHIQPPNLAFRWSIDLSAAGRAALVPGVYGAIGGYPWTPMNGLSVSRNSTGCGTGIKGRFVVLEAVYRTDGSVERFAADIEAHCSDAAPGIFLALRYNSSVSSLIPFNGEYPRYTLNVTPDTHGRVAGGGIDCGSGHSSCGLNLGSATQLTLTATPDFGYVFTGWTGDCRGALTAALHVNGPKECSARFEPLVSSAPRTVAHIDSQVGAYVGNGIDVVYSPLNSEWTIRSDSSRVVQIDILDVEDDWHFYFSAPEGQTLVPGTYHSARRYPFTPFNGLSVSDGTGCNQLTGRFVILEIVRSTNGTIERFAADFEQHCEDQAPAVFGAIRYNSTIDEVVPFGGNYPDFTLSVTPPTNGQVTATGLNCGGASTQCATTLPSAAEVSITATPVFGYAFMGWSGDCSGGLTTKVNVNGPKLCRAHFEPAVPTGPRTVLRWEAPAQPGGGPATDGVFSLANSLWSVYSGSDSFPFVRFEIRGVGPRGDSRWYVEFLPPSGEQWQVGRSYTATSSSPSATAAGLNLSRDSSGCSGGDFTIRQLVRGAQNVLQRFAVDFVVRCSTTSTVSGTLHYNATIDVPPTTLTLDPSSLQFASVHNGATVTQQPAPQIMRAVLSRPETPWTTTTSQPWIQITPSSGTGSMPITVSLNVLGGHPGNGTASGSITVTLADGSGLSKTANVTITLHQVGTTLPPFGVIDSPVENSTGVTGAIPMTGWVLDDLEVTGLTICRAAVAGEGAPIDANCGGAAQIFVGSGVFIEGARPDVQTTFPTHPQSHVGGWGFMLLTNTLPNQGNGTFTFYAYARDREGHVVQIGSRTMTCDNANATAPFGAIDTPGQGATIGGSNYINFGWALTQNPKHIPIDGSTIMVYVDGAPVGSPSYNHYRADIATTFPGLANSDGAVGFKAIDTTPLSNGLHTIVWTATDSAGAISGLGSRFFRVSNGGPALTSALTSAATAQLGGLAIESSPLVARRGWDPETAWRNYAVGAAGRSVLRGEEIDRFDVALGDGTSEATYAGYLRVGDRLDPLPVGSQLDSTTGEFSWSPGVGFIGTYDLVFVKMTGTRPVARREVRVIIQPKASGHVGTQVVIDTPKSQQDLAQPFALGGWAADLDAAVGNGIDTLHVWAYPLTGGAPIFLGTASDGGARPDVAAIHGDQFRESGFDFTVQGLPHGHYDLAVFAWSNVTGAFGVPKIVRITAR